MLTGMGQQMRYTRVYRGGSTQATWRDTGVVPQLRPVRRGIRWDFTIPSAGGGSTDVGVVVNYRDFEAVIEAMAETGMLSSRTLLRAALQAAEREHSDATGLVSAVDTYLGDGPGAEGDPEDLAAAMERVPHLLTPDQRYDYMGDEDWDIFDSAESEAREQEE